MAKAREDRFDTCRELAQAARLALTPPVVRPTEQRPVVPARPPSGAAGPSGQRPSGPVGPRPPYQIRVRRTEAKGEQELGPVYTDTLSLLETGALEELLGRAEFFALPPVLPSDRPQAGDVRQEITVISAGRSHTVGYDLAGSRRPAELDEFVGRLERMAPWRWRPEPPVAPGPRPVAPSALVAPPAAYPIPLGPPAAPPRPPRPWYAGPAALGGLAAVLVLVVVLVIVLVAGGAQELPAPGSSRPRRTPGRSS